MENGLRPVGHLQLAEDVGNVITSSGAEHEPLGAGYIGVTLRDARQDLAVRLSQFGERPSLGLD